MNGDKAMTITHKTPEEFNAMQDAGANLVETRDQFRFEDVNYVVVTYPAFSNENGTQAHDRQVDYVAA